MQNKFDLDTPALLVDYEIMTKNIIEMQNRADELNINLRPHTKTHRTPAIADIQMSNGAKGITVAKIGEAEVMAEHGITDIFIANEIVGNKKLERLKQLRRKIDICVGVDNKEQVVSLSRCFEEEEKAIEVLIEVEVGEERCGILPGPQIVELAMFIEATPNVNLKGIFSHEGHTYGASSIEDCRELFNKSQEDTLYAAKLIREAGIELNTISVGATPSILLGEIMEGITEIRPGTYILMDAAQGHTISDYNRCAASILATVISKPTDERIVLDSGVKALTTFTRDKGICYTPGYGLVKDSNDLRISKLYDEHGIIYDKDLSKKVCIGDKLEIIPNHICPTCNLYDKIYLIKDNEVVDELFILCRGRSQ